MKTFGQIRLIDFPRIVNNSPNLDDLRVFSVVVRLASFSAAAEQLAVSPAYVSKRVALLEKATRHSGSCIARRAASR
ncbi:hypothetical protein SZ29_31620 [Burkholderia pseudomallei]|nr:hypothetical protein SZ29_31620 [Burkholderia pseudomallei]